MNITMVAVRNEFTDAMIWRWFEIKPGQNLGIDLVAWATSLQADFLNVQSSTNPTGTLAITCEVVLDAFTADLFATDQFQSKKDFLIDTIMMQGIPRMSWQFEGNAYRNAVKITPVILTGDEIRCAGGSKT